MTEERKIIATPAKAGVQGNTGMLPWIPAVAGMTKHK
jgi:hypothetical protein